MRFKIPPIKPNSDNPFEYDKLDRKPLADSLTNLLKNLEDNYVLAIDAQWGEGKTTFLEMWQKKLESQNAIVIYYDAFKKDYFKNPLITIINEIALKFKELELDKELKFDYNNLADNFGRLVKHGFKFIATSAIKLGSTGALNEKDISNATEVVDDFRSMLSEPDDIFFNKQLEKYQQIEDDIPAFKDSLSSFAEKIREKTKFPLMIIVDEIDRCRPTFAIELLENIKHIFSVENVVFVLGINKTQLCKSIEAVYGNIDANTYLQKFVDLEINLPKIKSQQIDNIEDYVYRLVELFELKNERMSDEIPTIISTLTLIGNYFNLSLRDLEKIMQNFLIYYKAFSPSAEKYVELALYLIYLKIKNQQLYQNFAKWSTIKEALLDVYKYPYYDKDSEQTSINILNSWIIYIYDIEKMIKENNGDNFYKINIAIYNSNAEEITRRTNRTNQRELLDTIKRKISFISI